MSAMSTTSEWKLYLFGKTEAHRNWVERGKVGEGRIDLEDKNLTRTIFSGKDLTNSRFVRCDWSNSNISANFAEAEITECTWNNSLLDGIRFNRASVEKCNFVNSYVGKGKFAKAKVKGGDWTRCDLDKSTWTDAKVENVCFERANFGEARFYGNRFVNCDLRNANLESATLRGAVFENCDFRGAYFEDLTFEDVMFIKCDFHGCTGIPAFEGEYTFIEPDLSPDFDGTGIVETEELLKQWKSKTPLSLRRTTKYPQWLDYIFRNNEDAQADWVDEGMKDSPPMDVREKNLSRAFAYQVYFRAARFTDCDFTASDLRRAMVQQAEFIGCKFDDALLMYIEGRQETSLDVETTKVIFKDCTAQGAYFNRSELWIGEFIGGNWDGSFFNNCVWTLVEFENVSFENTDWRDAKLDGVKFINCNFRNALFHKADITASEFINCDFRGADFGFVDAQKVSMKQCAFYKVKGMVDDIKPLAEDEMRVIDADLSANFDGSLVFEPLKRTQDFFNRIEDISSDETSMSKNTPTIEEEEPSLLEITPEQQLSQLKQHIAEDKKQLKTLQSQLDKLEVQIENSRRTNIFGRPQSGNDKREKDKLIGEIEKLKKQITQNQLLLNSTAE